MPHRSFLGRVLKMQGKEQEMGKGSDVVCPRSSRERDPQTTPPCFFKVKRQTPPSSAVSFLFQLLLKARYRRMVPLLGLALWGYIQRR
jgi:hypothetical protein